MSNERMLHQEQVSSYSSAGFLVVDSLFSSEEVARLRDSLPEVLSERSERTVLERSGQTVRSIYGVHTRGGLFPSLARHPRLVNAARDLLKEDVYVYQSKVNAKAAFAGDSWEWHQDY